jgi:hypothetical protein
MTSRTVPYTLQSHYSIEMLREEARQLLEKGSIGRQHPLQVLCQYIPAREWVCIERELEREDFLLRDPVGDLLGSERWQDD